MIENIFNKKTARKKKNNTIIISKMLRIFFMNKNEIRKSYNTKIDR